MARTDYYGIQTPVLQATSQAIRTVNGTVGTIAPEDYPDLISAMHSQSDYDNVLAQLIEETASGSIVSFTDGANEIPVKSLIANVDPVQSGTGDPSPDNIRPITGRTSATVTHTGKNLYDKSTITTGKYITNTGTEYTSQKGTYSDFIAIKTGVPYYFSHIIGSNAFYSVAIYDNEKTFIKIKNISGNQDASNTLTFDEGAYIRVNVYLDFIDVCQIELGSTATAYEEYNGNTYEFAFGQTVYGGHFDNKGNLVVTHGSKLINDLPLSYISSRDFFYVNLPEKAKNDNYLCECLNNIGLKNDTQMATANNYSIAYAGAEVKIKYTDTTSVSALKTAIGSYKFVYELATPITLSITSQDIPTLLGQNNVWHDGNGNTSCTYYANGQLYIEQH